MTNDQLGPHVALRPRERPVTTTPGVLGGPKAEPRVVSYTDPESMAPWLNAMTPDGKRARVMNDQGDHVGDFDKKADAVLASAAPEMRAALMAVSEDESFLQCGQATVDKVHLALRKAWEGTGKLALHAMIPNHNLRQTDATVLCAAAVKALANLEQIPYDRPSGVNKVLAEARVTLKRAIRQARESGMFDCATAAIREERMEPEQLELSL